MKIILYLLIPFLSFTVSAQKQLDCLKKNLHEIETFEPDSSSRDLTFLQNYIKDRNIVSLGESTHGSKEIFQIKHRLIKYLIEECGYTVFAIEANMIECSILNNYIQKGKGDPEQLLANLGYWVWNTHEVLDLIKWMRNYNIDHLTKIKFTGFDMQSYAYSLYNLNKLVKDESLNLGNHLTEINKIDSVIRSNQANRIYQVSDSIKAEMYKNCIGLQNEIKTLDSSELIEYTNLIQYSQLLTQYATRYSTNKPEHGYRDSCMAQNLNWIKTQNPNSKIIVWAHNGHVKRDKYTMGEYLVSFGITPYVIGFSTSKGQYTAISEGKIQDNILQLPNDSCYEFYFDQVESPNYFIDLRSSRLNCKFLNKPLKFREIGSMKRKEQFFESTLVNEYDAIIHIQKTHGTESFYK